MIQKSIEVTLWSIQDFEDEFLGEVLLDLNEANLNNEIINYELHDHDENSSPLPVRKRKESCSDVTTTSLISPITSNVDTSSWSTSPCLHSSQNLSNLRDVKDPRKILPDTPAHDKVKYLLMHGRNNNGKVHPIHFSYTNTYSLQLCFYSYKTSLRSLCVTYNVS